MKRKFLFSFSYIFIIVILLKLSNLFAQTSSNIPLYKIIITEDINKFKSKTSNYYYESKGIGIIFNNNSDISLIPMNIFKDIFTFYHLTEDPIDKIENLPNGYKQYIIIDSIRPKETIHFILKDFGITFPIKELFYSKEEEEENIYYFRFLSKDEQENIIIGKDLIKLMNVTFFENGNYIINNIEYLSKIYNDNF